MPVSYNVGPGGLMYCPERDFAYNYPRMVSCVIRAFNDNFWPELLETVGANYPGGQDALWEEVCQVKDCYCQFLNTCTQDPGENVSQVLARTGVLETSPEARAVWFAMLGQVVTGQLFQGIRDVTLQGEQSPTIVKLLAAGRDAARALNHTGIEADVRPEKETLIPIFKSIVTSLRESGLSQQDIRDELAKIFQTESVLP